MEKPCKKHYLFSSAFPTMVLTNRFKGSNRVLSTPYGVPPAPLLYYSGAGLSITISKIRTFPFIRGKCEKHPVMFHNRKSCADRCSTKGCNHCRGFLPPDRIADKNSILPCGSLHILFYKLQSTEYNDSNHKSNDMKGICTDRSLRNIQCRRPHGDGVQ